MENESTDLQKRRQRFSISGLFYKASRDRKRSSALYQESVEGGGTQETGKSPAMNNQDISFDDDFNIGSMNLNTTDGPQKMLTMRDQEQIVQELKKENFDLKLRLYMTQKNSENNDSKVSEYEQQLGAVLSRFEEQQKIYDEQQRLFESQARELNEAKQRSRALLKKNQNLETQCKLKEEKIQNLSLSLNKLSTSMVNLSSPRHITHTRGGVQSMYFPDADDEEVVPDECDSEYPLNSTPQIVSRVAPMRRDDVSVSSYHDGVRLVGNERGRRASRNSYESTSSDPTAHYTKNVYNTTINNPQNDNVGIVKPNNSRTVVDVEMPENREEPPPQTKKKKKKGLLNVFKLCSGKSGQAMSREESIYHKKPAQPARITMTTYNNNIE